MSKIYVVGIGPGAYEYMTIKAAKALEECDCIVGYPVYVDLVKKMFDDSDLKAKKEIEFLTTPMKKEVERCKMAFEEAKKGKCVAMVCSGDAGVYGMSGLMLTLKEEYPDVEVENVSGVTATLSGAAVLGAPLIHDFAVISLSDLLTPWELIEKRIENAAAADFVMVFYNPSSIKRHDYLKKACDIILRHQPESLVCGTVENIGREGEKMTLYSLGELKDVQVDMFTTVFIGNTKTQVIDGRMVTPRGYKGVEENA